MNLSTIKQILIFMLFVIIGFGIYSNTLNASFHFDDRPGILENPHIRVTTFSEIGKVGLKSLSDRPVAFISFALNYYFHQYDLKGYHIVNIIIHILAGIFLYLFIKTTLTVSAPTSANLSIPEYFDPPLIAFGAALVWLVHPVQTQSVTYIVQRMSSLAAMFYLLSFLLYVKGRCYQRARAHQTAQTETGSSSKHRNTASGIRLSASGLYFSGSVLVWLLALGSKQTAATLPFFIFLYEWYFFQNLRVEWLKRHLKYLFGIVILFGFIGMIYMGFNPLKKIASSSSFARNDFTFAERVLTQPRVVIYYLSLLFYPHPSRLNIDYDFPLSHSLIDPSTTLLSLFSIIGLLGFACYIAKRDRLISFCILWYFGNLVIESSIIPLAVIFEHRTYMPSMFVFLMVILLAVQYIKPRCLLIGMLCAVVMVCSVWTYERNRVWLSTVTLWEDCLKKSPNKTRPHYNLAVEMERLGISKDAIHHYSEALRCNPVYVEAHNNLGNVLAKEGRLAESIRHYSIALDLKPDYEIAHNNLGNVLKKQGRIDAAIRHYADALRIKPDYADAHNNMGAALAEQGRLDDAIHHYSEALRINPDYAEAHNNMGSALAEQGRLDDAVHYYSEALRLKPDYAEAHNNLGSALAEQGRLDDAIHHYTEALKINPDYPEALNNLGTTLAEQGRLDDAIHYYSEALRIKPEDAETHDNLGTAFAEQGKTDQAVKHYKKALAIQPEFVRPLSNLAMIHRRKAEYDQSLFFLKKIIEILPDHAGTYYNIACIYAIENKTEESIGWLKEAVNKGYNNWELIKADPDLMNIRTSPYYKQFIKGR